MSVPIAFQPGLSRELVLPPAPTLPGGCWRVPGAATSVSLPLLLFLTEAWSLALIYPCLLLSSPTLQLEDLGRPSVFLAVQSLFLDYTCLCTWWDSGIIQISSWTCLSRHTVWHMWMAVLLFPTSPWNMAHSLPSWKHQPSHGTLSVDFFFYLCGLEGPGSFSLNFPEVGIAFAGMGLVAQ